MLSFLSPPLLAGMNSPLAGSGMAHLSISKYFLVLNAGEGSWSTEQESRPACANDHWKGRGMQWLSVQFRCWKRPAWEFNWMSYCLKKSWLFSPLFPGLSTRRSAVLVQLYVRSHSSVTGCRLKALLPNKPFLPRSCQWALLQPSPQTDVLAQLRHWHAPTFEARTGILLNYILQGPGICVSQPQH